MSRIWIKSEAFKIISLKPSFSKANKLLHDGAFLKIVTWEY